MLSIAGTQQISVPLVDGWDDCVNARELLIPTAENVAGEARCGLCLPAHSRVSQPGANCFSLPQAAAVEVGEPSSSCRVASLPGSDRGPLIAFVSLAAAVAG